MSITFNLYCNSKGFRDYLNSSTFIGSIFGTFIISYFAETLGRKKILLISWGIATVGIVGSAIAFDKYWLLITNFISGFGIVPCNSLNFVIIYE